MPLFTGNVGLQKNMGYQSSQAPGFLKTVERWIADAGEVLVMIRFLHAAGNRSYEFFSSFDFFQERVVQSEPEKQWGQTYTFDKMTLVW